MFVGHYGRSYTILFAVEISMQIVVNSLNSKFSHIHMLGLWSLYVIPKFYKRENGHPISKQSKSRGTHEHRRY